MRSFLTATEPEVPVYGLVVIEPESETSRSGSCVLWPDCSPPSLDTLCLYHHSQFHLLDFDVIGERREAAQG
jgi:hypothetical protein